MHAFQSFCYFLFAASAVAAVPYNSPNNQTGFEAHDKLLLCKNAGGNFQINLNKAEANVRAASVVRDGHHTKSGFPREYKNQHHQVGDNHGDGGHGEQNKNIVWPNRRCNSPGVKLLEIPVFPDGHQLAFDHELQPADKGKIEGAARAVFAQPRKVFCGVVARTEKEGKGPLALCE